MEIVVITGSAHKTGTSAILADEYIRGAKEAGHEVFRFDAAFKNIHPCIGCNKCQETGNGCVFKDDMQELNPKLLSADIVTLISPIYYFDMNAQTKTVIDRFFANNQELKENKRFVYMTTMADTGMTSCEAANTAFTNIANYMKWEIAGSINAMGTWDVEDMKKSDYPKKAYQLGKSL